MQSRGGELAMKKYYNCYYEYIYCDSGDEI